jgi:hypothetical protein
MNGGLFLRRIAYWMPGERKKQPFEKAQSLELLPEKPRGRASRGLLVWKEMD